MTAAPRDTKELRRYIETLRGHLDDERLQPVAAAAASKFDGPGTPVEKLRAALPEDIAPEVSAGRAPASAPFFARDPMVSLFQSSLESKLREHGIDDTPPHRGLLARIAHFIETFLRLHGVKFGPDDIDWVLDVAEAGLSRLAEGNHDFNPEPAEYTIDEKARLVVVGDWGSGLRRAQAVAHCMSAAVEEALAEGREAHVIHLGDVYYSGLPEEVERRVLPYWPVTKQQARNGVTSWSLNGNHDMYGGGYGYFENLLGDPRFQRQRSPDGRTTSFFHLASPKWDFVGLDTSWDENVLAKGDCGVLHDPQAEFVSSVAAASAAAGRKLMLFSHHQPISVYSPGDVDGVLSAALAPSLRSGRVTGWIWGHEHLCMGFEPCEGVAHPRLVGHGGVPVIMNRPVGEKPPDPGAWEARGYFEEDGEHWARFGFAVLDLNEDRIDVRYLDERGEPAQGPQLVDEIS